MTSVPLECALAVDAISRGIELVKLPETITSEPHTYRVVVVPDGVLEDAGRYGHTAVSRLIVAIDGDLPFTIEADTLWHEIGHIILSSLDLPEEVEERVCLALGPGLLHVLRSNPDLVAYTTQ